MCWVYFKVMDRKLKLINYEKSELYSSVPCLKTYLLLGSVDFMFLNTCAHCLYTLISLCPVSECEAHSHLFFVRLFFLRLYLTSKLSELLKAWQEQLGVNCIWFYLLKVKLTHESKTNLMKVKEKSDKAGLKINILKTKIMASSHITSWQIYGEKWKQWQTFYLGVPKSVTAAMKLKDACSLEDKLWQT